MDNRRSQKLFRRTQQDQSRYPVPPQTVQDARQDRLEDEVRMTSTENAKELLDGVNAGNRRTFLSEARL
jgi:hypothetical protein